MPMADGGKEAERKRLAEALRANLKRRKAAPRPASPARDEPQPKPASDGERG